MSSNETLQLKDTIMNLIESLKKTYQAHKPEFVAAGIIVGAVTIVAGVNYALLRNRPHLPAELLQHLRSGRAAEVFLGDDTIIMFLKTEV